MVLIEGWVPPTRENYQLILTVWQWSFPIIGSCQWLTSWYGMGKTSVDSVLNIPGRVAWFTMEVAGPALLVYIVKTLPALQGIDDLPWQNRVLVGLFLIHYAYRGVVYPFLQPSMSPIHLLTWLTAVSFQFLNATCLGAWLAGYGPTTQAEWASTPQFVAGMAVFYVGMASNFFHDEELREIRRRELKRRATAQREEASKAGKTSQERVHVDKHYEIPRAGLFRYMLFPHYFSEWVEWTGFWMAAGWGCAPARAFVVNEVLSMFPRTVRGKAWYVDKFGEAEVGKKWASIPGVW